MPPGPLDPHMSTDAALVPPARALPLAAVRRAVRALGFWLAVALPLAYLPLLSLPAVGGDPGLLAGAVGVNLVALAVGHGHEPSIGRRRRD